MSIDKAYVERLKDRICALDSQLGHVLEDNRQLQAQRDHAYDCLKDLLDFVYMIAPEASAEEINEAKRVLGSMK